MGSTTVEAPAARQYSEEMKDALLAQMQAQRGTGPFEEIGPMINLEQEYRPRWTGLELQTLQQALQGTPGTPRTVQDTRMVTRERQVMNQDWVEWQGLSPYNKARKPEPAKYISESYETPEVYDRTIEGEAIPGLLSMYRDEIAPVISEVDRQALEARTAAEQGIIDQYGQDLANKLRDAAGNRQLI